MTPEQFTYAALFAHLPRWAAARAAARDRRASGRRRGRAAVLAASVLSGHCPRRRVLPPSLSISEAVAAGVVAHATAELEFTRAGGDCVCPTCGKLYYDHPPESPPNQFLCILCDGRHVKL